MNLKALHKEFGGNCFYCRKRTLLYDQHRLPAGDNPHRATRDHDVPKCRMGVSGKENEVLACLRCNQGKGDMTGIEFVAFQQTGRMPETYIEFLERRLAMRLGMQPRT